MEIYNDLLPDLQNITKEYLKTTFYNSHEFPVDIYQKIKENHPNCSSEECCLKKITWKDFPFSFNGYQLFCVKISHRHEGFQREYYDITPYKTNIKSYEK